MVTARILIVEDETIVAMDIERGLRACGYEVVGTVGTGEEAVRLADQFRPDIVLMDIRLRGEMDGIEAGRHIRSRYQLPIVFLTAYADDATVQRAKEADPFGYLLKPFEDQELHTAIEIALHKRNAERQALDQVDEALRQSEQRFRLLVDNLKDYAVFLLDTQGKIVSWNPGARRINGYDQAEVIGRHVSIFYQPGDVVRNRPDQLLLQAAREGQACDEGWRVRKDGTPFWADIVVTALRDKEGRLVGFAKIARDVTEKKRAEEAIRELNTSLEERVRQRTAELTEANRELEAFTYSVAHDLRGPLRGLRGFLHILQEELGPLSAGAAERLSQTSHCAERMTVLIDSLLNLSRIGRQGLEHQPTSLAALLDEVLAEVRSDTEGRVVRWRIDPLPVVECDPSLIKQVFVNLLCNALKYSRPRQEAIIAIGQTTLHGETVFYVRDNGVGFDMEFSNKLFQPFSRLHPAREFQGTGIGLATVERIIRKHGGRIWAESKPGQGAVFYFTLGPRARMARAAGSLDALAELHTQGIGRGNS
jgi:PAS domain S-box-containing protein